MSDLFHEAVNDRQIADIFAVMASCSRHVFQVLTKRPERMRALLARNLLESIGAVGGRYGDRWPLPNVWLGVSVENQATADERIPLLLDTPAAVRFLSVEPLLGPVDLRTWMPPDPEYRPSAIDWCIVGGESGPKARPCRLRWIGAVLDQCTRAGVSAFVKQLGSNVEHHSLMTGELGSVALTDRKGGDPSEWPPELRVREFPR